MERTYFAFLCKDRDSDYGVTFPDFPGCTSGGGTFKEAREMAREALALHLEGISADGEFVPPPCSPDTALGHEDASYAIALIVVEALPERTEEEAQAAFDAFLASDEYREIYGQPLTEDDLEDLPDYRESVSEALNCGIGLRPVTGTNTEQTYAALVRQDTPDNFAVSFPDLPGCVTAGNALEQACKMAREVLALHLSGMAAGGEDVPTPSCANDVLGHPDAADAVALIVVEAEQAAPSASAEYRKIYGEPVPVE
jgi:predicted RNase H-like HicB family nuclease